MGFKEFKEKVETDKEFAAKVKACKNYDEAVAFGKENGYAFTVEDIKGNTTLSDLELDSVAGGNTVKNC